MHGSMNIKSTRKCPGSFFVDFSGAYDSIPRAKLIEKLKNMNIEGNILAWFSRFLV